MTPDDYRTNLLARQHGAARPRRRGVAGRRRDHARLPRPGAALVGRRAGPAAGAAADRRLRVQRAELDAVRAGR